MPKIMAREQIENKPRRYGWGCVGGGARRRYRNGRYCSRSMNGKVANTFLPKQKKAPPRIAAGRGDGQAAAPCSLSINGTAAPMRSLRRQKKSPAEVRTRRGEVHREARRP